MNRPFRFTVAHAIAAVCLAPVVLHAADKPGARQDGKKVRLAWFPRYSPDGKWLLTALGSWVDKEGGEVRVWHAETGEPKFVIPTDRGVRTVAWAPSGKFFVSGDYGGAICFYDAATGERTAEMKLPKNVEVLLISPDEKKLVAAAGDGSVRVYELPSRKDLHIWKQLHRGGIWGMALSPDGKTLCTGGQDDLAHVLDLERFTLMHNLPHPADINGVVFTNNNKHVLTGCGDAAIRVFGVQTGEEVGKLTGHQQGSVTDLWFSPDGKLLASAGMDRTVRLWDVEDLYNPKLAQTLGGYDDMVFGVAISPDGKSLATADWSDQIKVFDLKSQKQVWAWRW